MRGPVRGAGGRRCTLRVRCWCRWALRVRCLCRCALRVQSRCRWALRVRCLCRCALRVQSRCRWVLRVRCRRTVLERWGVRRRGPGGWIGGGGRCGLLVPRSRVGGLAGERGLSGGRGPAGGRLVHRRVRLRRQPEGVRDELPHGTGAGVGGAGTPRTLPGPGRPVRPSRRRRPPAVEPDRACRRAARSASRAASPGRASAARPERRPEPSVCSVTAVRPGSPAERAWCPPRSGRPPPPALRAGPTGHPRARQAAPWPGGRCAAPRVRCHRGAALTAPHLPRAPRPVPGPGPAAVTRPVRGRGPGLGLAVSLSLVLGQAPAPPPRVVLIPALVVLVPALRHVRSVPTLLTLTGAPPRARSRPGCGPGSRSGAPPGS